MAKKRRRARWHAAGRFWVCVALGILLTLRLRHSELGKVFNVQSRLLDNPDWPLAQEGASPIQDLPAFAEQLWQRYQARLQQRWGGPDVSGAVTTTDGTACALQAPVNVYTCSHREACGGWGDRLQVITSVFYYSLLTDANFDIQMTDPFDISEVYPMVAKRRPCYNAVSSAMSTWNCGQAKIRLRWKYSMDMPNSLRGRRHMAERSPMFFKCHFLFGWREYLERPTFSERARYYGLTQLTALDMFRVVMQLYFSQSSPELQQQVQDAYLPHLGSGATFRVGVHVRTGGYGQQFAELEEPLRIEPTDAVAFADRALEACRQGGRPPAKQWLTWHWKARQQQHYKRCAILITSDAEEAVAIFQQRVRSASEKQQSEVVLVTTEGPATHLDLSKFRDEGQRTAFLKTFLDWELLRRCDFLVLSRSGFSETAAWSAAIPSVRIPGDSYKFGWDGKSFLPFDTVVGKATGRNI